MILWYRISNAIYWGEFLWSVLYLGQKCFFDIGNEIRIVSKLMYWLLISWIIAYIFISRFFVCNIWLLCYIVCQKLAAWNYFQATSIYWGKFVYSVLYLTWNCFYSKLNQKKWLWSNCYKWMDLLVIDGRID